MPDGRDSDIPGGLRINDIPADVGLVTLHDSRPAGAGQGSTSHDGHYLWVRPFGTVTVACDLEGLDSPAAVRMAAHFDTSTETFLRFWTLLETIAKIEGIPADIMLRRHQAQPNAGELAACYPAIRSVTDEVDGMILTVGWLDDPTTGPAG